jgi:hypothetical protein
MPILIGMHISLQAIRVFNNMNPWAKLTLSGLLGALVFIPLGLLIDHLFKLDDWSPISSSNQMIAMIVEESGGIILSVTFTWIAINAPRILKINFKEARFPAQISEKWENGNAQAPRTNFISLIPKELGSEVIYLKSELHYVRVVTTLGETLVLFNMKDAIADLEKNHGGIQTHRSYWVSARHIQSLITDKSRQYVLTNEDQRIPVSRRKHVRVKAFINRRLQNHQKGGGGDR